jgi:hypothetical protein
MNERKRELAAVGLLLGALFAAEVRADPPAGTPKGEAAPGKGPQGKGGGLDQFKPKDGVPGKGKADEAATDKGKPDDPGAKGAATSGERHAGRGHSELRALRDELKAGKLKKEDVEGRLAKLRENNKERQDNHRAALKARWGEQLAKPDAQQELALHERRMAKLNRVLLLAQTERKGKDADKLTERIEKLIELESSRHEKRMAQINGAAGTAPASPPAAVNVEGAK